MTLHMIDIASYQRGINLDAVRGAGFTIANVKTSQGNHYTFSDARMYASQARERGMGVSLFHWLDNSSTGATQAAYAWKTAGPIAADNGGRVAFQVDNEDNATWAITRDFVVAIADKLGHRPYMYTGDWWAASSGRAAWNVASLTPWLMAAPNAGYLGAYPGDTSAHWRAGYWGYTDLSLMQYAVDTISGASGGNISKAAIRDPNLWAALTGQEATMAEDYGRAPDPHDGGTTAMRVFELWLAEFGAKSPGYGTPSPRSALLTRMEAIIKDTQARVENFELGQLPQEAVNDAVRAALQDPAVIGPLVKAINDDAARRAAE